ncbi:MAG: response regulator transcription factor [Lachnospiraceae bacterium]|nr:response regulator transcription factor [Lachnospiraceae bacterium]
MDMYRVLLVDDEKLLLDSLEIILSLNGMEIIGKASDGRGALQILEEKAEDCDIALVDLNMKGMGGIELIKVMKERFTHVKILVLTTFYDDKYITEAIAGGADGYLLKDSGKDAILGAVTQILSGVTVLDQQVMAHLAELMAANSERRKQEVTEGSMEDNACDIAAELTSREKEICALMAEGLTNRQIADKLYISEGTVKNYISNIYDKTGIHDRVKLVVELKR